ncbi:TetR/AcrR family transcriptional regulator [Streptomyces mirabilis]|uniref:TetR/AcrR family transcriptional regulator n=1 Tax=Streptomyces mirabilis TaxID=68239 RepID=UPI0036739ECD
MATTRSQSKPSVRDRLLAAADELFYTEGVQTVGIDRIIEHAGVAKASLYNTFGGKEQLVRAYLDSRHTATTRRIIDSVERQSAPVDRLLAVFDALGEVFGEPDFHGCAFITASAESRPGGLIEQAAEEYRAWVRTTFTELARDAGAPDPAALAWKLQLLYDGAGVSAHMDGDQGAASAAREAARALLVASVASNDEASVQVAVSAAKA